jgi:hypothetical protein
MGLLQEILESFGLVAKYKSNGKKVRSDAKLESFGVGGRTSNTSKYEKAKSRDNIEIKKLK